MHGTPRPPRPLAALLCAAALAGAAWPLDVRAEEEPVGKPVAYDGWMGTLPTGLRLLVYQRPGIDRVAVGVSWLAGAVDDPEGKEGLAHLVEHLAFRARSAGSTVWARLQGDGAVFNAFTEHDATVYFEIGKPDQLGLLLAVEADRMRDPLGGVTETDVAAEKAIVTSELREAEQFVPWYRGLEALEARLFPADHPYHRSVGGTAESVGRATLADVRAFVKKGYTPERAVMVIVAPGPTRQTAERAMDALGTLATGDAPGAVAFGKVEPATRPPPPMPPAPDTDLEEVVGPVRRPILLMGFAVPGDAAEQVPMGRGAAGLVGAWIRGRLSEDDMEGEVAGVGTWLERRDGAAELIVSIQLEDKADAERVLEKARDALIHTVEDRAAARLAKSYRDRLLTDTYLDIERFDVAALAAYVRATGKADALKGRQAQIIQLNRSLDSYAYEHLRRGRSAAVLVRPDPADAARLVLGASGSVTDRLAERHEARNAAFVPTRPVAQVAAPPGLDQAVRTRLRNGLEVVVARRGTLPFAEVRLVMRTDLAGTAALPAVVPELALALHGRSSDRRWNHGYRIGLQSWRTEEADQVTFGMRGSAANLGEMLDDVGRWPRSFTVDRTGFTVVRAGLRRHLLSERRDPEERGLDALHRRLYPDHPYGVAMAPPDLEKVSLGDVERWTTAQLRPDRATLIVVGDVTPEEALAKAKDVLGGWSNPDALPVKAAPPAPPAGQQVLLVDRPGAKLALLLVGLRLPGGAERDDAAAEALSWRLDSSLMDTLRVDAGVTYGVRVVPETRPLARSLVVQTAVDAAVTGDALGRLFAALEALAQVPLPEEALDRARWQVARRHARSFDTVAVAGRALERLALEGLPPDHYERQAASIAALDAGRVQALAKRLVGHEVAVVVGDARALLPQLKDAGFDPEVLRP